MKSAIVVFLSGLSICSHRGISKFLYTLRTNGNSKSPSPHYFASDTIDATYKDGGHLVMISTIV
jgi:hypothetical protein